MNYLSIPITLLTDEKYLSATDAQKSAWINLMLFCASVENHGVIENCKGWNANVWIGKAFVKKSLIDKASPLWKWEEFNLKVEFYSVEMEERAAKRSRNGKKAASCRWVKENECEGNADASDLQCGGNADASDSQCEGNANAHAVIGKGVIGKGKEEERERSAGARSDLSELVELVQTAREDFRFREEHLVAALMGAPKENLREVVMRFCGDFANTPEIPRNPLGMLRGYLRNGDQYENGSRRTVSADAPSAPEMKRFAHGE